MSQVHGLGERRASEASGDGEMLEGRLVTGRMMIDQCSIKRLFQETEVGRKSRGPMV